MGWSGLGGGASALSADFSTVGASQAQIQVYAGTQLVGSAVVPGGGTIASIAGGPALARVSRAPDAPLELKFDRGATFTPSGGPPMIGNRVLVAAAPGPGTSSVATDPETLEGLDLLGAHLDSLVLGEHPATSVGVAPGAIAGARLAIDAIHPNPSPGRFAVALSLPSAGAARLEVFDLQGRRVMGRDLRPLAGGRQVVDLEARSLADGIYLVRATQGGASAFARAVVIR